MATVPDEPGIGDRPTPGLDGHTTRRHRDAHRKNPDPRQRRGREEFAPVDALEEGEPRQDRDLAPRAQQPDPDEGLGVAERGVGQDVANDAVATPKLMAICCIVLAMVLALLACSSVTSA